MLIFFPSCGLLECQPRFGARVSQPRFGARVSQPRFGARVFQPRFGARDVAHMLISFNHTACWSLNPALVQRLFSDRVVPHHRENDGTVSS
jgi:hypothetical protein